jgi:hypothetical protein
MTYLDYVSLHCHSLQVCCRRGEEYYVNDIEGGMKRGIQRKKEDGIEFGLITIIKEGEGIKNSRVSRLSCHL